MQASSLSFSPIFNRNRKPSSASENEGPLCVHPTFKGGECSAGLSLTLSFRHTFSFKRLTQESPMSELGQVNSALDLSEMLRGRKGGEGGDLCVCVYEFVCTLLHRWATETGGEESWSVCPWDWLTAAGKQSHWPAEHPVDETDSEYWAQAER